MSNTWSPPRRPRQKGGRTISPSGSDDHRERHAVVHRQLEISGPLPPPQILKGDGDVDESFPQRIMAMAEAEQAHRHSMERQTLAAQREDLKRDRTEARLGQTFALVIGLAAIVGGVVAAVMGAQWSGSIIGGGGVIGLVAVFVKGRQYGAGTDEPRKRQPSGSATGAQAGHQSTSSTT